MTKLALLLLAVSSVFLIFIPFVTSDITQKEIDFANAIITDSRQQRTVLKPNQLLTQYAKWKCSDMANRHYFAHITPDKIGPNVGVKSLGYTLPNDYDKSQTANNIESLGKDYQSIPEIIEAFWKSKDHREHVFGQTNFFRQQNEYGVAVYVTPTEIFYCLEIARRNNVP